MTTTDREAANSRPTDIAIVGLGSLFPEAADLRQFWANVVEARDCIRDVPETHWRIEDHYDPDPTAPDKTYARRGGFVPTVDFDPMEFGLPPNVLEVTDILQLLSLVVAKQTLQDADVHGSPWYDSSRTGVILGVTGANSLTQPLALRLQTPRLKEVVRSCGLSERDADEIAKKFVMALAPWQENSFPGMLGNVVAGRIANRFDLGGTNCTVDAACASSLAALHMAIGELATGRADLMITGGCDAENTILMYMCFSKTPAFSRNGVVRPFDESADGTLIGEGIGMLALKRLADAERDGDRIYGVLRGVGSSSDGRFKSIYAPRADGQATALRRAYAEAGFGPEQIGLLECHATGTSVGDLTELKALGEVFGEATDERQFAAVGSVKSQIGHTKGAAGAASLIKVALALHHKVLPPTINVDAPRAAAELESSPFYVNTQTRPWVVDPARPVRRAAVSAFGFGGTNFHCVLEEHLSGDDEREVLHPVAQVHTWHAENPAELLALLDSGAEPVSGPIPAENCRLAVVAASPEECAELRDAAAERLRGAPDSDDFELPGGAYYRRAAQLRDGKVAAMFAGQGSQYVGMGAATAMSTPPVRAAFDSAAAAHEGPVPLGRVVFPPPAFDDAERPAREEALRRTENAQLAIGALAAGQYRYLADSGFAPDGALGHSFGELTALWAAGSLSDAEFYSLAGARGRSMARLPDPDADPGGMAAISATTAQVEELLGDRDDVVVCNVNAPDQVVVGGATEAVREFVAECRSAGVSASPLPVAAAFHTKHVAHALEEFGAAAAEVSVLPPKIPVYANTAGAGYRDDSSENRRVLVQQLAEPVQFGPSVEQMYADGFRVFVEFGPKSALSGLVRRTLADRPDVIVLAADPGPGRDGDRALKQLAARLTVLGVPLTGLNRFAAEPAPEESEKKMSIPLNGVNYVPEERRRNYQEALENGYRVDHAEPPAAQPSPQPLTNGSGSSNGNGAAPRYAAGPIAADHLDSHRVYLDSQLAIAHQLSGLLAREAEGSVRDSVLDAIRAVTQHGVSIGQSHQRASEVLGELARLEAGLPSAAPTSWIPADPAPAPEPLRWTAHLETPPAADGNGAVALLGGQPEPAAPAEIGRQPEPAGPPAAPEPAPAAPALDRDAVRDAVLAVVAEKTGYPSDMLDLTMDVESDLGIDSIKRVEIMGVLGERFPNVREPSPEMLGELRTLGDIVGFLAGETAPGGPAEEVAAAPKA
ncbi:beta-ketoacyl synthase N-terminal-like domain-containing protein [Saccharopolyspora sp. NPDC002686]|uniref:beta-ketoacyl synthase N-terminal-like domain-containing protein n=1 Tax=Saccharopolyspora sp. NPDC002686 TaxID=3154541 RepID=UPI003318694E